VAIQSPDTLPALGGKSDFVLVPITPAEDFKPSGLAQDKLQEPRLMWETYSTPLEIQNMFDFNDKVVLITGASYGLESSSPTRSPRPALNSS
jgi:hypothetical protein